MIRVIIVMLAVVALGGCRMAMQERVREAAQEPSSARRTAVERAFADIAPHAGLDPGKVWVATTNDSGFNAASLGGGAFTVTAGIAEDGDPCLLWGVVAHELAHDQLGHSTRWEGLTIGTWILGTAIGVVVPGGGFLVDIASQPAFAAYSRTQEADADARAVDILTKAGKPPWALRWTLERLAPSAGGWLSTHPATAERIAAQPPIDGAEAAALCVRP